MKTLLKNGWILTAQGFEKIDITVTAGRVVFSHFDHYDRIVDCSNSYIIPGLVDVHVHLREPGFFYKETIKDGTRAAARGGYTTVCTMPNVDPVPSNLENLKHQLDIITRDALIHVYPYGTITKEQNGRSQLSDMASIRDKVIAFSDDGKGVQTGELMEQAMRTARALDKKIVAHCEEETLLDGGYIHKGRYAQQHGHKGISSESEWKQVERDLELCRKTGVNYHICHISTKETVALVREAKRDGINVTCETAPHYLILCDEELKEDGCYKMNPPLRGAEDREALLRGLQDGTIDMIATDHAPHSAEEKSKGLKDSAFGIVGLETAFSVLYTALVKTGKLKLERLIDLMALAPRRVFDLPGGYLEHGQVADLAVLDLDTRYKINPDHFLSKGRSTPFKGMEVQGENKMTFITGSIVWEREYE